MNRHAFVFCFLLSVASIFVRPGLAQNLLLKSGQTVETKGLRRSGDMVMCKIQVGSSRGEVGYQASTIAKIDFPEPPQLKAAATFLSQGEPKKALVEITPTMKYFEAFRDLPGNWWAQAALLKVSALGGMQLDKEAATLGEEIRRNATDPETARAAQLQLTAGLIRTEQSDRALQICDQVIKQSAKPELLAEAWVRKGEAFLSERKFDNSVLAYLHVPVFYPDQKLWMPSALLGCAKAFRGLDDPDQAKKSLADLITEFPKSPQGEIARAELKMLAK